jgi:hypothetical protein
MALPDDANQVLQVSRFDQGVGRPADPKRGVFAQRNVESDLSFQTGGRRLQIRRSEAPTPSLHFITPLHDSHRNRRLNVTDHSPRFG